MKKLLRILGYGLSVVLVLLLIFAAFVNFAPAPTYEDVSVAELTVPSDSAALVRGFGLVANNCQNCHQDPAGQTLSGRMFDDRSANKDFGTIYTANITRDPEYGIGNYTDGELYRLLRTGIKRNHERAVGVMPTWPLASDQDIYDIIAFLRSDHRWVAASEQVHPVYEPTFLSKALHRFVLTPAPLQASYPPKPSLSDSIAYGAYQVNSVNLCYYCHSADIKAANALEPAATPGYLAGGFVFPHTNYDILAPSLIPTADSEVGKWTIDEFVAAVKYGQRPGKPAYQEPMHPFNTLDTAEVRAIYYYLSSLQ